MEKATKGKAEYTENGYLWKLLSVFILVLVLGMALFLHYYEGYNEKLLYEERLNQMKDITAELFVSLENVIQNKWDVTGIQCEYLEKNHPGTMEELYRFLENQAAINQLDGLGDELIAVDDRGSYYNQKGAQGTLTRMEYFVDREEKINYVFKSLTTNETQMCFFKALKEPFVVKDGERELQITYAGIAINMDVLKPYFVSAAYQGNNSVYVVDNDGVQLFNGNEDQLLKGYNVYNVLRNMRYLHGSSFDNTLETLAEQGYAYSNAVLDGEEYYYALYRMDSAKWTLLFLVPSKYVATNTVTLVNTSVSLIVFFSVTMLISSMVMLAVLMHIHQQKEMEVQRQTSAALEEINTQLDEKNTQLSEAIKAAEEASRAKSDFLSNMSHDIRTPMNAIVGIVGLMEHENGLSDKMRGYIEKVQLSSRHLLGLINDVLDMSRIESKEVTLHAEHVSLAEQIEQIDSIIRPQTNERHQSFHILVEDVVHEYLICDGVRLRQIALNLLSNAVKYTGEGGKITLSLTELPCKEPDKASYRIKVTDTGYGMTPEFVEHIFEPFTRAENSVTNKVQGTGLGMAITKHIVDLMGGTIYVESKPGVGSCFEVRLTLPIDREVNYTAEGRGSLHFSETEGRVKSEETKDEDSVLKGMKFLCAEDNELNAEILQEILQMYGASGEIFADGEKLVQAFEKVKPGEYDAILMDIQMPRMNGLEAARAIRESSNLLGRTIPIIAMTANAFSEDVQSCMDAGMDAHIAKPLDMKNLEKILRGFVDGGAISRRKK